MRLFVSTSYKYTELSFVPAAMVPLVGPLPVAILKMQKRPDAGRRSSACTHKHAKKMRRATLCAEYSQRRVQTMGERFDESNSLVSPGRQENCGRVNAAQRERMDTHRLVAVIGGHAVIVQVHHLNTMVPR